MTKYNDIHSMTIRLCDNNMLGVSLEKAEAIVQAFCISDMEHIIVAYERHQARRAEAYVLGKAKSQEFRLSAQMDNFISYEVSPEMVKSNDSVIQAVVLEIPYTLSDIHRVVDVGREIGGRLSGLDEAANKTYCHSVMTPSPNAPKVFVRGISSEIDLMNPSSYEVQPGRDPLVEAWKNAREAYIIHHLNGFGRGARVATVHPTCVV